MTTKELREIAERLTDSFEMAQAIIPFPDGDAISDSMLIVKAWLVDHRADDDILADRDWLALVGADVVGEARWLKLSPGVYLMFSSNKFCIHCLNTVQFIDLSKTRTRGNVRRLCAALGVKLREKSA